MLGRLATRVATLLRGKHKPVFTTHLDTGDGVIIINTEKIRVAGRKAQRETVYRYSGYPGGLKAESLGLCCGPNPSGSSRMRCAGCFRKRRSATA